MYFVETTTMSDNDQKNLQFQKGQTRERVNNVHKTQNEYKQNNNRFAR